MHGGQDLDAHGLLAAAHVCAAHVALDGLGHDEQEHAGQQGRAVAEEVPADCVRSIAADMP